MVLGVVRQLVGQARTHVGAKAERDLRSALQDTVDEVGAVAAKEGVDCHFRKGGMVMLARNSAQLERARQELAEARSFGYRDEDLELLSASKARELVGASRALGALYRPHCATIHPARLARGLAELVERLGVSIFEKTAVKRIAPGRVVTAHGTVRAEAVVRPPRDTARDCPRHTGT